MMRAICRHNYYQIFFKSPDRRRINSIFCAVFMLILGLTIYLPNLSYATPPEYKKPEDVVAWLYRDFSWEATMSGQFLNESLIGQPKKVLSLYFTDDLISLIFQDRACVKATHELCNLDFDPIFVAQDPSAVDIKIAAADKSNTVHVRFRYASNQQLVNLNFIVEKTTRGWRVSDIIYSDGQSLRKILSGGK